MILLADSGSTKTEWVSIENHKQKNHCFSSGINPYFIDKKGIIEIISNELLPHIGNDIPEKIFFYGSGCSTSTKKATIENALKYYFPNAEITIEHDLLAAARSLCQDKKGIACILGTGSNSCLYDGKDIIENVTSLGYFFGDEGSGGYLGKLLLNRYLRNELSTEITELFNIKYNLSVENILDSIYNKPKPNRFLASFSPFVLKHLDNIEIRELVKQNFVNFFNSQVCKYSDYQKYNVSFIGSIAYHFSDILKEIASQYNIKISAILQSPMSGLIDYHTNNK